MIRHRGGLLLGAGLAVGIVIGAAGSTLGASPQPAATPGTAAPWSQMIDGFLGMSGAGAMMGGGAVTPGSTFGPGMMGSLDPSQRDAVLKACDAMHDAMHGSAAQDGTAAPDGSGTGR